MWKPYHYIITFGGVLQTSALENPLVFADKKYTHPIKDKQEVKCYLPWKSYSALNFLHLVHNDFSILLQRKKKKSLISKPCVGEKKICPELYHSELATRHCFFTMPDFTVHRYCSDLLSLHFCILELRVSPCGCIVSRPTALLPAFYLLFP